MVQNHKTVIWNFDGYENPPDGYLLAFQATTGLWVPVNVPLGINRKLSAIMTSNYTALATDDFIRFDTSAGVLDGYLPTVPILGKGYTFADVTGHAATNNLTVEGNGFLIAGNPSFTLTSNFQTLTVVFNGVGWSIV